MNLGNLQYCAGGTGGSGGGGNTNTLQLLNQTLADGDNAILLASSITVTNVVVIDNATGYSSQVVFKQTGAPSNSFTINSAGAIASATINIYYL